MIKETNQKFAIGKTELFPHAEEMMRRHVDVTASKLHKKLMMTHQGLRNPEGRSLDERRGSQLGRATRPQIRPERPTGGVYCLDERTLRKPFLGMGGFPLTPRHKACTAYDGSDSGMGRYSGLAIPSEGVISLEAAVGEFIATECSPSEPWLFGEANRAYGSLGLFVFLNGALPAPVSVFVDVDIEIQEPNSTTNILLPGRAANDLNLVGLLGWVGLNVYGYGDGGMVSAQTYQRFLLSVASPVIWPEEVDRLLSFSLSQSILIRPNTDIPALAYGLIVHAALTAFRTPYGGSGQQGIAYGDYTHEDAPGGIGSSGTPIVVKEIRSSACLLAI